MIERDFQLGGSNYKLSKVDVWKQLYIAKRLGPIIGEVISTVKELKGFMAEGTSKSDNLEAIAQILAPLLDGFSKLTDKDLEYVMVGLLNAVEVQQEGGSWARMAGNSGLMFDNIELATMLQLAGRALVFNLGNFSRALPQGSKGGK